MHLGKPKRVYDPVSRRVEFVGPAVNVAAWITTLAQGGQILLSSVALSNLNSEFVNEKNRIAYLGKFQMPDSLDGFLTHHLFFLCSGSNINCCWQDQSYLNYGLVPLKEDSLVKQLNYVNHQAMLDCTHPQGNSLSADQWIRWCVVQVRSHWSQGSLFK